MGQVQSRDTEETYFKLNPNDKEALIKKYSELGSAAKGGKVLEATDELFGEGFHLIKDGPAIEDKNRETPNGFWKLASAGTISGFDIDTSFFDGSHPSYASVDACLVVDGVQDNFEWKEILPKVPLSGNSHHYYGLKALDDAFTHVRLKMYPDGGIARLRIYGNISPIFPDEKTVLDLASLSSGGRVIKSSDDRYGKPSNIILPTSGVNTRDGWQTRRSREEGHHDWVEIKLGATGILQTIEVDTTHFRGNNPDFISLDACNSEYNDVLYDPEVRWVNILKKATIEGDKKNVYTLVAHKVSYTHVRLNIFPDGGISRLRVFGIRVPEPIIPLSAETVEVKEIVEVVRDLKVNDTSKPKAEPSEAAEKKAKSTETITVVEIEEVTKEGANVILTSEVSSVTTLVDEESEPVKKAPGKRGRAKSASSNATAPATKAPSKKKAKGRSASALDEDEETSDAPVVAAPRTKKARDLHLIYGKMTSPTGSVSDLLATSSSGVASSALDASTYVDPFSESNPFAEDSLDPVIRPSQSLNFNDYYPRSTTAIQDDDHDDDDDDENENVAAAGETSLNQDSNTLAGSFSAVNLIGGAGEVSHGHEPLTNNPNDHDHDSEGHYAMSFRLPENGVIPWFEVTVGEPQKVGDVISPHIVYKVHIKTNSTAFKSHDFTVQRRYRDFLWLYNQLTTHNPGVIVPPVSEKHAIGRFQDDFVESRRIALEKCLRKMTAHPMLYGDPDLKLFLESESLVAEIKEKRQDSSKGFMTKFGETLSSATTFTKVHETDEWFESRRNQLDVLDTQLKSLLKAVEAIVKQRKDLGSASAEFGESIVSLAGTELNKPLANSLLVLGNLKIRIKELHDKQAQMDVLTLEHTVDEYIRTIGSIKIAFMARAKYNQNMVQAQNDLSKKKANFEKMNQPSRKTKPERIQLLQQEIVEAEQRVDSTKRDFEEISSLVRQEFDRFDREKVEDFKQSVEAFLASMVKHQREIVGLWENYFKALNGASEEQNQAQQQQQAQLQEQVQAQAQGQTHTPNNALVDSTAKVRASAKDGEENQNNDPNDILSANAWSS
ncbi:Vacuolar protein sorting-associated protein 5 [Entomortierella beljakovae]|nr:Vacuolar protein sorting-associated protein 5 [Entomortierella beljakovae]